MKSKLDLKRFFLFSLVIMLASCSDDSTLETERNDDSGLVSAFNAMVIEIKSYKMISDPDHDFATIMRMHHQGAITMTNKYLVQAVDSTMTSLVRKMVDHNTAELEQLNFFINNHAPAPTQDGEAWDKEATATISRMEKNSDLEVLSGDIDHDLALLLIDHHQAALDMIQSLFRHGHHSESKTLAAKIFQNESNEIEMLQDWLLQNKN